MQMQASDVQLMQMSCSAAGLRTTSDESPFGVEKICSKNAMSSNTLYTCVYPFAFGIPAPLLEGFFDWRGQGNTVSELVLLWERT